jgi:hypothetical protein
LRYASNFYANNCDFYGQCADGVEQPAPIMVDEGKAIKNAHSRANGQNLGVTQGRLSHRHSAQHALPGGANKRG